MADLAQVEAAFLKADQAGDAKAAAALAGEVRRLRAASQSTPIDPTEGMSGFDKFAAGAGKAMYDLGRGAAQLVGKGPTAAETDEQKRLDAPLMKTGAGMAGNLAGNVAASLPTMLIPGVNTLTGAAAVGGALGAMQPVGENDSRLTNTAISAGAGLGGQALGNALGRAVRPVQSTLNQEEQRLAQVALREGIPLDAAAQTGSKPLQTMNAVFEHLPFTAGPQAAQGEARNAAFTAAALRRAGVNGNSATPPVLAGQRQALGQTFEDIAGRNVLDFNQGLTGRLAAITDDAAQHLPPDASNRIAHSVDQILSQVGQNGQMAGTNYQGWRTPLRDLAQGGDATARYYGQLKRALDEAFGAQVPGADAEAWRQASREYGNLKTIMQSMGGAGNAATAGNIAPAQLANALSNSVGREGRALGRGDLNDLVRVGTRFVRDQVPNSGTAQRQLIQSLLTGGGGAGLGAAGAGATGQDPLKGAMYGAGAAGLSLAAPRLVQALMQSAPAQGYMVNQATSPNAAMLARLLQNSGRSVGAAAPLALTD